MVLHAGELFQLAMRLNRAYSLRMEVVNGYKRSDSRPYPVSDNLADELDDLALDIASQRHEWLVKS